MRLDRLELLRYGKFTDYTLEFGQCPTDQPDLHIVYGPNEAGKTTLMAAYLDFLFGFERKPKPAYNFLHTNSPLKVGAVIRFEDEAQEYRRLKKDKDSLVDTNDQPISDGVLLQQLAGLNKNSYENMFSLNDDTLEKGGESILASEGDLGKLLYSATTGVAQLSDALSKMRVDTELFYKKEKRKFELAELKKKLKDIEIDRKAIDTEANAYSKLVRERDNAETSYAALGNQHDKLKVKIKKRQLDRNAYPRLVSLERLRVEMQPLAELPDTSPLWSEEVKQLKKSSIELGTTEQALANKLATLDDAINAIELDSIALEANEQWQLIGAERENYLVASKNLPDLQQQARLNKTEIDGCLQKLERNNVEQPKTLVLSAAIQENIKALIKQQPTLLSQLSAAESELATAEAQNKEYQHRFIQQGGSADSVVNEQAMGLSRSATDELELSIAAFTNNELSARYKTIQHHQYLLQDELAVKIAALTPWHGDIKALQQLTTPHSAELQLLQRRRDDMANRVNDETISLRKLEEKLADTHSRKQSFNDAGLVDDAESVKLRQLREETWQEHRKTLDSITADLFEQAMRADDASQTSRLQHTESLAQLTQLNRETVVTEKAVDRAKLNLQHLSKEQQSLRSETDQLVISISPLLTSNLSIEAVGAWIDAREDALQADEKLTHSQRELAGIEAQACDACATVEKKLALVGAAETANSENCLSVDRLTDLLKTANGVLKREATLAGLRDQLITSQHQLKTRKSTVEKAQASLVQWTDAWQIVCKSCWIGADETIPGTITVEGILHQLALLEQQLAMQSDLQDRIEQHQLVVDVFAESLSSVSGQLSIPTEQVPTDQLYQTIHTRMDKAVEVHKSLSDAQAQKQEIIEQQQINQEKKSVIQTSIDVKSTHFSVANLDDVELKLQEVVKKQELQKRFDHERDELLNILEVTSLSEAHERLANFNSDAAQLELSEYERTASDIELQLREAHTIREDMRRAVENVGGDEAVALLIEQRANILLEIEEKIARFLQQHLALNAADAALKIYRDNHRSSMMTKASDVFARISQGRYIRLETFQAGASEQLIAIEHDGRSKLSSELSKGTRFQLYLALRVAGYHEYVSTHPSVPFIADDIMETSDDERAMRTFEVLGNMAKVGQVIYLTHHQHLCDIARTAVPGCVVHELPTTTVASASTAGAIVI